MRKRKSSRVLVLKSSSQFMGQIGRKWPQIGQIEAFLIILLNFVFSFFRIQLRMKVYNDYVYLWSNPMPMKIPVLKLRTKLGPKWPENGQMQVILRYY